MSKYFEIANRADRFFEKRWFVLPILSATLLILSFYPLNLWFLNLVAFAPFFYFLNLPIAPRKLFLGGFLFGAIFSFSLNYFTVIQFHWLPETYLFKSIINLSFIPLSVIGALAGGIVAISYESLRSRFFVLNILTFAAISTAAELFLNFIFGGYFLGMLPLTADTFQPLIRLASVGGMFLVSFLMYSINGFAGLLLSVRNIGQVGALARNFAAFFAVVLAVFALNEAYLNSPPVEPSKTVKVAVLQNMDREEGAFATTTTGGSFKFNKLEGLIRKASAENPNLIIYPFSPVVGALYFTPPIAEFNKKILVVKADEFAKWLGSIAPKGTIIMTWDVIYNNGEFLNQNDFWLDGRLLGSYRKRNLFPFADYTPEWAQKLSFYTTPFDIVPGKEDQVVSLGEYSVGDLICSEISNQKLASKDSQRAQIIISAGSEAMFADNVASAFNLMHARYRAAENNVPVIRANRFGPSAIIAPDGSVIAGIGRGEDEIMAGEIEIKESRRTVFNMFGNAIIIFLIMVVLLITVCFRIRKISEK